MKQKEPPISVKVSGHVITSNRGVWVVTPRRNHIALDAVHGKQRLVKSFRVATVYYSNVRQLADWIAQQEFDGTTATDVKQLLEVLHSIDNKIGRLADRLAVACPKKGSVD